MINIADKPSVSCSISKYNLKDDAKSIKTDIFPYGYIYIVKGTIDKLWWIIKDSSEINNLEKINTTDLNTSLKCCPLGLEKITYVIHYSSLKLDLSKLIKPDVNIRAFIWLPCITDKLEGNLTRLYKKFSGGYFKSVDLSSYDFTDDAVIQQYKLETNPVIYKRMCSVYKHHPFKLQYVLQEKDYYIDSDSEYYTITELISSMVDKDVWNFKVREILASSKQLLHAYFAIPDSLELTTLFRVLHTVNSPFYCPDLWVYYNTFYNVYESEINAHPSLFLKIFLNWVGLTTHYWYNGFDRGLYYFFTKGNKPKKLYGFRPSIKSIQEFSKLISS